MAARRFLGAFLTALVLGTATPAAGEQPRSTRLVKDAGNQFLAAKKYADAINCYFQVLQVHPEFAEVHYNLAVAFIKGYQATGLAQFHFDQYLRLAPDAPDHDDVLSLWESLRSRAKPVPRRPGQVVAVIGGRLLIGSSGECRGEVAREGVEAIVKWRSEGRNEGDHRE